MHPRLLPLATFALSLVLVPCWTACHDSSSGGGSSPSELATADILIHDAALDDLLSFSAQIRSVRLLRGDGAFTPDLLTTGEVRVEFLGLGEASALLVRGRIPATEYGGVEIGFTPASYRARAESGLDVTVDASADTFLARLPTPLILTRDEYVRLDVDLNLSAAVSGNVVAGNLAFAPEGTATSSDGTRALQVRDTKARVTAIDEPGNLLTVEAFADDGQAVSLGERLVRTDLVALYLDLDDSRPDAAQFYDELIAGQTLLEVHGTLGPDGVIQATRIDIEDHSRGAGSIDDVCIEGTIVGLDASSFALRINDIEDGSALAQPIIVGLPNQSVLDVSYDAATVFVLGETLVVDETALSVGRRVAVKFCSFATSPFAACVVDVDARSPQIKGVVMDVGGVPERFVMRLDRFDPMVMAGLVQSDLTDVEVDLGASTILFAGAGNPVLLPSDLAVGMELQTEGTLSGSPLAPTYAASEVRVPGGRLDALVSSVDQANARFTTSGGTLVDPFGPNVTDGSQLVMIQPGAVVTGAASSTADLFTMLNGPQGATTQVSTRGLGTASTNEIRAFELHVKTP